MTKNYSLELTMPSLQIDIDIKVADRDLLIELDETIKTTIAKHYNLRRDRVK